MYSKNQNITAEWLQLTAEITQTVTEVYLIEVTSTSVYSTGYERNSGCNYWEWFLNPPRVAI